jgi:ABC-2 type transport system permease protein
VVFLLPIIVRLVYSLTNIDWIGKADAYLISNAGSAMAGGTNADFEPWQNVLVVAVWTVVSLVAGAVILMRRDA